MTQRSYGEGWADNRRKALIASREWTPGSEVALVLDGYVLDQLLELSCAADRMASEIYLDTATDPRDLAKLVGAADDE